MQNLPDARRRLTVDAETLFVLSDTGRILRENDPDRSAGPRLFIAGCPQANLAWVRHDVAGDTARRVQSLAHDAPPWIDPDDRPQGFAEVVEMLQREAPIESMEVSLICTLPRQSVPDTGMTFVCSGTAAGRALLERLQAEGMPQHLIAARFVSARDFWEPWCVVLDGGAIAATAFAARLGTRGAEAGVYTFPGWRSRGLAAGVTAKWASLPELAGRDLFYSMDVTNISSRRVADRLGLQPFAVSVRVT
jgi:hypothetical protein